MKKLLKVQGVDGLYRDPRTGVIINTDNNARIAYENKKAQIERQKQKTQQIQNDIDGLKSEMSEIKYLLSQLLQKLD